MGGKTGTKAVYFDKLKSLLEDYNSVFIGMYTIAKIFHLLLPYLTNDLVSVDNVSSQQMHEIRMSLRGEGVVLMGKNTMVRRAIKGFINDFPEYERLLPHVKGYGHVAQLLRNHADNISIATSASFSLTAI